MLASLVFCGCTGLPTLSVLFLVALPLFSVRQLTLLNIFWRLGFDLQRQG